MASASRWDSSAPFYSIPLRSPDLLLGLPRSVCIQLRYIRIYVYIQRIQRGPYTVYAEEAYAFSNFRIRPHCSHSAVERANRQSTEQTGDPPHSIALLSNIIATKSSVISKSWVVMATTWPLRMAHGCAWAHDNMHGVGIGM